MGWRTGAVVAPLVIIEGAGGGLFVYQGTPAAGNPPVFSVVAPGVTKDPFGNTVAAVLQAGTAGTGRTQIDAEGDILLSGADGQGVIRLAPAEQRIVTYADPPGLGQLLASMASRQSTDPYGNTVYEGLAGYSPGGGGSGTVGGVLNGSSLTFYTTAGAPVLTIEPAGTNSALVTGGGNGEGTFTLADFLLFELMGLQAWLAPSGDTSGATDHAEITNALASYPLVGLLPGTFYSDAAISLPGGTVLHGINGYRTAAGPVIKAVGMTAGALIQPAAATPAGSVIGIELDGTGLPAGAVDGIGCYVSCKQGSIIDVVSHNFTQHGINITQNGGNPDGWFVAQVSCHNNASAGVFWDYAVDGLLEVAHLDNNNAGLLVGTMNNWSASGVRAQQNATVGYGSTGGFIKASAAFTGCGSENNGHNGWDFTGTNGQGKITFEGCWARDDGTAGSSGSGYSGFALGGLGNDLIKELDGCVTYVTSSAAGPDYGLSLTGDHGRLVVVGGMFAGSVAGYHDGGGNTAGNQDFLAMITAVGQDGSLGSYATTSAVNGTMVVGGSNVQASGSQLEVEGAIGLQARAAPGTPPAGYGYLYVNSTDSQLHFKDSSGTDHTIT